ncbi:MAG: alkaline phosphatase D family protein, partial [Chthoniobacteraceae bacterium]
MKKYYAAIVSVLFLATGAVCAQVDKVSLGDAHKGTLEIELRMMNEFVPQPKEAMDFYAACREAMVGSNPKADVAEVCRKYQRDKIGGPMLGAVAENSVKVWMHLPELGTIRVVLKPEGDGPEREFSSGTPSEFPLVRCDGLSADQAYSYRVLAENGGLLGSGRFTTPPTTAGTPFKIAFGCDFHKIGLHRPELMELIRERGNRAVLLGGDLAVDDRRADLGLVQADYMARDLSPFWQKLAANVPVFATWDDHDYFADDAFGTTYHGKPIPVADLRRIWEEEWNNPEPAVPGEGIYFQTRIGPVQVIMLDTRSCRVAEQRGQLNSFLGAPQMAWLKQTLAASDAPFILLSSGTMWSDAISDGKDSWGTWDRAGREEIFRALDAKTNSRVLLLSGDRHGARGFTIPRPEGKKFYEVEVGSLGGVPGPAAMAPDARDQLFGYQGKDFWAFAEFQFEMVGGAPQITARLINEKGVELQSVIANGRSTPGAKQTNDAAIVPMKATKKAAQE